MIECEKAHIGVGVVLAKGEVSSFPHIHGQGIASEPCFSPRSASYLL